MTLNPKAQKAYECLVGYVNATCQLDNKDDIKSFLGTVNAIFIKHVLPGFPDKIENKTVQEIVNDAIEEAVRQEEVHRLTPEPKHITTMICSGTGGGKTTLRKGYNSNIAIQYGVKSHKRNKELKDICIFCSNRYGIFFPTYETISQYTGDDPVGLISALEKMNPSQNITHTPEYSKIKAFRTECSKHFCEKLEEVATAKQYPAVIIEAAHLPNDEYPGYITRLYHIALQNEGALVFKLLVTDMDTALKRNDERSPDEKIPEEEARLSHIGISRDFPKFIKDSYGKKIEILVLRPKFDNNEHTILAWMGPGIKGGPFNIISLEELVEFLSAGRTPAEPIKDIVDIIKMGRARISAPLSPMNKRANEFGEPSGEPLSDLFLETHPYHIPEKQEEHQFLKENHPVFWELLTQIKTAMRSAIYPHPAAIAFASKVESGKATRTELLEEAQRLSGIRIYDAGTFSEMELGEILTKAVFWTLNGTRPISEGFGENANEFMPLNTKHLVLGHGFSSIPWQIELGSYDAGGSPLKVEKVQHYVDKKVQRYVDRNVPKGEEAWVAGKPLQNLFLLEGHSVVSRGVHKNINTTPGNARQP